MKNPALSKTLRWSVPPEPQPASGEQQGALTVLSGHAVGSAFTITADATVLGRSPEAAVRLQDDGISRCHARILRRGDVHMIEDLASTNGTYVGGLRIVQPTELRDGARIQIGPCLMRFSLQDDLEQEAARRLYEASVRDGLTGLFNRRHFDERLSAEYAFAIRHRTPLSVLVIDIDYFKSINDRWGHPAGDAVLQALGRALQASLRSEDLAARFGGEEFVILCRGIDVPGVRVLAERVRRTIEALRVQVGGETLQLTASIGIGHNSAGGTRGEHLVAAADTALYQAKRAGRNRVEGPNAGGQYALHRSQPAQSPASKGKGNGKERIQKRRTWDGTTQPTDD